MFQAASHPFLVPTDGSFRVPEAPTSPPGGARKKKECRKQLARQIKRLKELQHMLYAQDRFSILLIFQAMDAAGKDGTIRAVMSGINPAGCQVYSFKKPTPEELDHDFLWRTSCRLPERGRIGIFNRSYYEEVLVVRVHPEYLRHQRIPDALDHEAIWRKRFESICEHEEHLARNGTVVLKFWLNVSKEEQRRRFLARIDVPEKNWKFSSSDVDERRHWDAYMSAYEEALNATSRPWAPWYAIPADDKPFMRLAVARVLVKCLESLDLHFPVVGESDRLRLAEMREILEAEESPTSV